ncbi:unnamed protein product, partial [Brassica rapa subsp. narinosa]
CQHLLILGTHGTSNEHSASTMTTNTHIISICVSVAQTQESILLFSSHQYLLDQSNTSNKDRQQNIGIQGSRNLTEFKKTHI